jgi:hypothetical protein
VCELSDFKEFVHNGECIDWNDWVYLSNITPYQAARLAYCIDPIKWDGNQFSGGGKSEAIPKDLTKRLLWWEQWLANIQSNWSITDLIAELGDDAPTGMVEAVPLLLRPSKRHCKPSQRALANTLFYSEADRQKDIQKKAYLEAMQEFEAQKVVATQHLATPLLGSSETQTTTVPPVQQKEKTKLEKQRAAILAVIKLKGFDPMAIPDGEKGTIEDICRADYQLLFDAGSSFTTAWKNARHLFKMANHASYSKLGRE